MGVSCFVVGDDVFALLNCDEDLEYGARHLWGLLVGIRCIFSCVNWCKGLGRFHMVDVGCIWW